MKHLFALIACFLLETNLVAQTKTEIESHGSKISLTFWEGAKDSKFTVILVPGWSGGPNDVMGLGKYLSEAGITVVIPSPRGWRDSEGESTFANSLEDIKTTVDWVRNIGFKIGNKIISKKIILGGHSWGGGMSLAYAAGDTSMHFVFSIAGTDHAQFIRLYQNDEEYAKMVDEILASTGPPDGPIRFDVEKGMKELMENQSIYGLVENADNLADRSILLFGAWDDKNVTIDETILPLYRALQKAGAKKITLKAYQGNHSFKMERTNLQMDLLQWIKDPPN